MIDTSPEVREMEDGTLGYFYNLHQLEAIRDKKMFQWEDIDFFKTMIARKLPAALIERK